MERCLQATNQTPTKQTVSLGDKLIFLSLLLWKQHSSFIIKIQTSVDRVRRLFVFSEWTSQSAVGVSGWAHFHQFLHCWLVYSTASHSRRSAYALHSNHFNQSEGYVAWKTVKVYISVAKKNWSNIPRKHYCHSGGLTSCFRLLQCRFVSSEFCVSGFIQTVQSSDWWSLCLVLNCRHRWELAQILWQFLLSKVKSNVCFLQPVKIACCYKVEHCLKIRHQIRRFRNSEQ